MKIITIGMIIVAATLSLVFASNSALAGSCSDTDGGINYDVKGTAAISGGGGSGTDYCLSSTTLVEFYCNSASTYTIDVHVCPYGCSNGACNPAPACVPQTCSSLGKNCGTWSDGCQGWLSCGTCSGKQVCSGSGICSTPCSPRKICTGVNNCGTEPDGCGGTINCGTCTGGQVCSYSGTSGVCYTPCAPKSSCSSGKNCGSEPDGCGGNVVCGSCGGGQVCSGSPSGACADPHWVATGTDLSVPVPCAARECFSPSSCNSDGTCAYSASPAGTNCTGGKCFVGSCDKWPPFTSISLDPALPNGINGWYVSQVAASITCSDVGSGCQKITYTTDNGAHWYDASASSTPFAYGVGPLGDGAYYVKAYSSDKATLAGSIVQAPVFPIKIDSTAPSVSVSGAPAGWVKGSASASAGCSDSGSGCDGTTYRLKTYSSNPGSCSNSYADYPLSSPSAVSSRLWVCAAAKDSAGNAGFSSPVEFKVDNAPPSVSVAAAPFPPCTLDATTAWIDCSATISVSCSDADSGCKASSYGYRVYDSNPGTCPSSKSSYVSGTATVTGDKWGCAYAEDVIGNGAASSPSEIKINKTFAIIVAARAYGDIDVPAGTEVKAYLCLPSQYFCNQDAAYLASGSGIVGADKKFSIALSANLERGQDYKVGIVTEKGYAESEFVA